MWEDKGNKDGGRWLLTLDKKFRRDGVLDSVWMETVYIYICIYIYIYIYSMCYDVHVCIVRAC